jgi:hypothetical protein
VFRLVVFMHIDPLMFLINLKKCRQGKVSSLNRNMMEKLFHEFEYKNIPSRGKLTPSPVPLFSRNAFSWDGLHHQAGKNPET